MFWWSARLLRETVPLLRYAKYWAQVRNLDCMLAHEQRRVTPLGSDLIWVGKIHQQISWPKQGRVKGKSRRTGCCLPLQYRSLSDFIWSDSYWCVCVLESRVTDPKGKSMHHDDYVGPLDSWTGEDFTFHWVERLISRCQWKFCNLRGFIQFYSSIYYGFAGLKWCLEPKTSCANKHVAGNLLFCHSLSNQRGGKSLCFPAT